MKPFLSIIIPVYNETENINRLIHHLSTFSLKRGFEVIVVDGNPSGNTIQAIKEATSFITVTKILSTKGRGVQQNTGALHAKGEVLLFLHADTTLDSLAFQWIASVLLTKRDVIGGAFDLGIDSPKTIFRIIERISSLRSRITCIPYGDQAVFMKSSYFKKIGGFALLPIMEDVEFMQRVKKFGGKIHIIPKKVHTSSRRWENEGVLCCTLRNWVLIILYYFGVSPVTLAKFYVKK